MSITFPLTITWFPPQDTHNKFFSQKTEIIVRSVIAITAATALGYILLPKANGRIDPKILPTFERFTKVLERLPGFKKILPIVAALPDGIKYRAAIATALSPLIVGAIAMATAGTLFKIDNTKPF